MKSNALHPAPAKQPIALATLLTKSQTAESMGLSVRTLEGLVAKGEFPQGVRIGRFLFWTDQAIAEWHQRMFAAQLAWRP